MLKYILQFEAEVKMYQEVLPSITVTVFEAGLTPMSGLKFGVLHRLDDYHAFHWLPLRCIPPFKHHLQATFID